VQSGGLLWATLVGLTLITWGIALSLALARRSARKQATAGASQEERPDYKLLRLLMLTAWLYSVVPSLIQVATSGRSEEVNVEAVSTLGPTALLAGWLLTLALVGVSAVSAVHYSRSTRQARSKPKFVLVALAPWFLMLVLAIVDSQPINMQVAVYPLIVLAIAGARPPLRTFALMGWLTIASAGFSILLGIYTDYGTISEQAFVDKALVGTSVLAGPYSHSNMLGTVLALGLPSIFLISSKTARIVGSALIAIAVLWSASRTSIAAVAVILILLLVSQVARKPATRLILGTISIASTAVVLCYIPLTTHTLYGFNYRGRVWTGSLRRWETSKWFGAGPDAYRNPGGYSNFLGQYAFHGHNLLVDALAVGGITMAVAITLLVLVAARRALHHYSSGEDLTAYFFVMSFAVVGILEVATDFWLPSSTGLIVWLLLSAVLFSRREYVPISRSAELSSAAGARERALR
jgi:O-antigen ligase